MKTRIWFASLLVLLAVLAVTSVLAVDLAVFSGRPAFSEGDDFGYYLWKDGDTWKVRWTTFGGNRHFTGSVHAEGGELDDLKRIDVDAERRVVAPGRPARVVRGPRGRVVGVKPGRAPVVATKTEDHITREDANTIRFSTRTDDDLDGFDFKVRGGAIRLRFVLQIDGRSRPVDVSIGRNNVHPAENPFIVPLR
ncbi:MAG: hypothetical protein AB1806_07635 [Acidobacteriota bacterium]